MIKKDMRLALIETANALVALGKGILAADESLPTIEKRFVALDIPSTEDNRRAYREMLLTTPGIGKFISGVILFDETIRQMTSAHKSFPDLLREEGIMPGIKVDKGTVPLPAHTNEKLTAGLDGLNDRLREYATLGARFAKWRAVIAIGSDMPSLDCIKANAERLAVYALACQEQGIVPIVEPEVLMDGDHSQAKCEEVTTQTLRTVFSELEKAGVALEGIILKPNMVLAGKDASEQPSVREVAEATLRTLRAAVPPSVPGIAFLSGGQSEQLATTRLNEMNTMGKQPWQLTFSYSRALQASALKTWHGQAANVAAGQKVFYYRAKLNSAARSGTYTESMENFL